MSPSLHPICSSCRAPTQAPDLTSISILIGQERKLLKNRKYDNTPLAEANLVMAAANTNDFGASEDIYMSGIFRSNDDEPHDRRSWDAIFQSVRLPDGTKSLHTAKPYNVGPTSMWLQLDKHTWSSGMISLYLAKAVSRVAQGALGLP
jgi:hypothetical protein